MIENCNCISSLRLVHVVSVPALSIALSKGRTEITNGGHADLMPCITLAARRHTIQPIDSSREATSNTDHNVNGLQQCRIQVQASKHIRQGTYMIHRRVFYTASLRPLTGDPPKLHMSVVGHCGNDTTAVWHTADTVDTQRAIISLRMKSAHPTCAQSTQRTTQQRSTRLVMIQPHRQLQ